MQRSINKLKIASALLPLTLVFFSHQVSSAVLPSCASGTVTVDGYVGSYSSCLGAEPGNDDLLSLLNDNSNLGTGFGSINDGSGNVDGSWALFGKSDDFIPVVSFTKDEKPGEPGDFIGSGAWEISDGSISDPFVLVLKASSSYSAYLFEDLGFGATGGTYDTLGVNVNGDFGKQLSHLSLYSFAPLTAVPIPGAALLFGSALLGMFGFSLKNRSKKSAV